jgi:hypothetical protein
VTFAFALLAHLTNSILCKGSAQVLTVRANAPTINCPIPRTGCPDNRSPSPTSQGSPWGSRSFFCLPLLSRAFPRWRWTIFASSIQQSRFRTAAVTDTVDVGFLATSADPNKVHVGGVWVSTRRTAR